MSYILDALRRAEAQRERNGVPDLHAQPQGTGAALPPSRTGTAVVWAIFGVLALAALAAAWWLLGRREAPAVPARDVVVVAPAAPAVPTPPVAATPPVTAPAAPAVVAPAPAPAAVPAPPSPSPAPAPAPAAAPAARSPAVAASPKPAAKEAKSAAATASRAPIPAAPPAATTPVPAPAPAANEPRIYTREELPGDIRGQLPQLKITGSTYSENPSSRMLIANGQIFYENEKIAPDTTLVQIRQTSAILSFRGFRYAVPY